MTPEKLATDFNNSISAKSAAAELEQVKRSVKLATHNLLVHKIATDEMKSKLQAIEDDLIKIVRELEEMAYLNAKQIQQAHHVLLEQSQRLKEITGEEVKKD